jgi:hypothetical protein
MDQRRLFRQAGQLAGMGGSPGADHRGLIVHGRFLHERDAEFDIGSAVFLD